MFWFETLRVGLFAVINVLLSCNTQWHRPSSKASIINTRTSTTSSQVLHALLGLVEAAHSDGRHMPARRGNLIYC